MKKFTFFAFIFLSLSLSSLFQSINILAQGDVVCVTDPNLNCVMGISACQSGYIRPYCAGFPNSDCCTQYYSQNGACPQTISCVAPTPTIAPSGCTLSINPTQITAPANFTLNGSFTVYTGQNCSWSAVANNPWIHMDSGTGIGSPTGVGATFHLDTNTGSLRTGTITTSIDGQTPVVSQVFTITQQSLAPPSSSECPSGYSCITTTNCSLADGNFPRNCSIPAPGNCCLKPSSIPTPGTCTDPRGCFACDWTSTNNCFYNPASANNCAQGYTYDAAECDLLDSTTDYICRGTLFPCVPIRQGSYAECSTNGCVDCNPNGTNPNCVPFNSCSTTCNNADPTVCNGICRTSCLPNEATSPGSCTVDSPVCCAPVTNCTGQYTGFPGQCAVVPLCPRGTVWDGINPLDAYRGCSFGQICCVYLRTPRRPMLQSNCIRNGIAGINTALGCIPIASQTDLLVFVLQWAIGLGGGVVFVLIVVAGIMISTSAGDKNRVQAGKELLSSAIGGLLLIIFSVFILDAIGIRILHIPGL